MTFADPAVPVPLALEADAFVLRPITVADAAADHAALMDSRVDLRLWEQSSWPEDDFTIEANRADLDDMQRRHEAGRAYSYTVEDPGVDDLSERCIGCVYMFPTTATFLAKASVTALADEAWSSLDAVVYFWVRSTRNAGGLDAQLLTSLRDWFAAAWRFDRVGFAVSECFEQQVALFDATEMPVAWSFTEPGKPSSFRVYLARGAHA